MRLQVFYRNLASNIERAVVDCSEALLAASGMSVKRLKTRPLRVHDRFMLMNTGLNENRGTWG